MSATQANSGTGQRRTRLLTQNRELKQIGAWNWSLPAWAGRLPDGRTYNTCPSAGVCRWVRYARSARNFIYCKAFLPIVVGISNTALHRSHPKLPPDLATCRTSFV
jgi:hypothetical protein